MMNNPYDPRLRLVRRNLLAPPAPDPGPAPIGINPGVTPPPPIPPPPPGPPPGFVPTARDPYGLPPGVQPPPGLAPGDQQVDPTKPNYVPPGFHRWSDGSIHSTPEATFRGLQQNVGQDINTPLPNVPVGPPQPSYFPPYLPGAGIPGTNQVVPGGPLGTAGPGAPATIPSTPTAPPMSQHMMNHPTHMARQIAALQGRGVTGDEGSGIGNRYMRLMARNGPMDTSAQAAGVPLTPGTVPGVPGVAPATGPGPIPGATPGSLPISDILPPDVPTPAPGSVYPSPGTVVPGTPLNGAPPAVDLRRFAPPFQPSPGLLGGAPAPRPNMPLPPFDPSAQLLGQSRNPRRRY